MKKDKVYRYGKTTVTGGVLVDDHCYYGVYEKGFFGTKTVMRFKTREKMMEAVDELKRTGYTLISY